MTCIVGLVDKKNKRVIIGADSAGVAGWHLTIRKDSKVFIVGDFIIGCTSSFRMIDLLKYSFAPPMPGKKEDIAKYMATTFINEVRKTLKDGGYLKKDSEQESGGVFLVGYKSRLFFIDNDFQVGEAYNGMDSCGCGYAFALGALHIADKYNGMDGIVKVRHALEAADKFSAGVSKPFNILTT